MINNKHNNDEDFLKTLVQKSALESPSENFTKNVMKSIEAEVMVSEERVSVLKNLSKWILPASGIGFAVAFLIYYYIKSGKTFIVESFDPLFLPVFKKLYFNFIELFGAIQVSSITLVIISAIVSLLVIERILKKFQVDKNVYFSF